MPYFIIFVNSFEQNMRFCVTHIESVPSSFVLSFQHQNSLSSLTSVWFISYHCIAGLLFQITCLTRKKYDFCRVEPVILSTYDQWPLHSPGYWGIAEHNLSITVYLQFLVPPPWLACADKRWWGGVIIVAWHLSYTSVGWMQFYYLWFRTSKCPLLIVTVTQVNSHWSFWT